MFEETQDQDSTGDDEDILAKENQLLKIIAKNKAKKYKDSMPWHELISKATKEGLDKNAIEDLVNNLLNKGKVYEPMLGRIKCTNSDE